LKEFTANPEQWKKDLLPFAEGAESRCKARLDLKAKIYSEVTDDVVTRYMSGRKKKLMNKFHYKIYQGKGGVSNEEASLDFDDQFAQNEVFDSEDEPCVEVRGYKYIVTEKGTEGRRGTKRSTDITEDMRPTVASSSGAHRREATVEDSAVDDAASLAPSTLPWPSPRRTRPPSHSSEFSPRQTGSASVEEPADAVVAKLVGPRRKKKRARVAADEPNAEILFLQSKTKLKDACALAVQPFEGPRGTISILKTLVNKHATHPDVPDTRAILLTLEEITLKFKNIKDKLAKCMPADIDALTSEVDRAVGDINAASVLADTKLETLSYIDSATKKEQRSNYLAERHQKEKVEHICFCMLPVVSRYGPTQMRWFVSMVLNEYHVTSYI
jgi:hypothetical protein